MWTGLLAVFEFENRKTRTTGPVFCSPGPVQSWSLAGPRTEPANTTYSRYLPSSPPDSEGSLSSTSPVPTLRMLKMSMSPEDQLSCPPLCLASLAAHTDSSVVAITSCGSKRSASPVLGVNKKRSVRERIHSKDFGVRRVPLDVRKHVLHQQNRKVLTLTGGP
jgi:hypothetical protein